MANIFDSKFGQAIAYQFYKENLTTGMSATDLTMSAGQSTSVSAINSGSVVGISLACSQDNPSAGWALVKPSAAGTAYAQGGYPSAQLDATNTQNSYTSVRPGIIRFAKGDRLGVSVTTGTALSPTNTLHIDAVLYVQYDPL